MPTATSRATEDFTRVAAAPAILLFAPYLSHEARHAICRRLVSSGLPAPADAESLHQADEASAGPDTWLAAIAFDLDDEHTLAALVSHPRVRTVAAIDCRVGKLPAVRGRGVVASYSGGDDRLGDAQRLMNWARACCLEFDLQAYSGVSPSFMSDGLHHEETAGLWRTGHGPAKAAAHAWRRTTRFIRAMTRRD